MSDYARAAALLANLPPDDDGAVQVARETVPPLLNGSARAVAAVRAVVREDRKRSWGEDASKSDAVLDAVLGRDESAQPPHPLVRSLADILSDPTVLEPPVPVVPRLAWRGRVTLLAAREKAGKSTLVTAAASPVTTGGHWLGDMTTTGPVLIIALEEHMGDLAARCQEWGADPSRLYIVDSLATAGEPMNAIRAAVDEVEPALLIVDTLAALVAHLTDRPDPGSSTAWTPIMAALTRIARETDAAVLLLHHARKSDGAYRDSTAIGAGVDVIALMSEDGQDADVRRIKVKARWAVPDYSVRMMSGRYELSSGEVSLDARVLLHIESHPGTSMRALRSAITGANTAIDAAVSRLIERGALQDHGDATTGRQLHTAGHGSGHTPVPPEKPHRHAPGTVSGHGCAESDEPYSPPTRHTPDHAPPSDLFDAAEVEE